jgi:phospholipase/carboxylesterase
MRQDLLKTTEIITINDLVLRIRMPKTTGPNPVILMLHGRTGDQDSMWVFSDRLPEEGILIAPRGFYQTEFGGYTWHETINYEWPNVENFQPAAEELFLLFNKISGLGGDMSNISVLGFSQGAALGYILGLMRPETIKSIACLSGFLPGNFESYIFNEPFAGKRIFITHGTRDKFVPVEKARESVSLLQKAGATVTYCEDDVGHKLSAHCFRSLSYFYQT